MRESSTWYSLHILDLHSDQVACHLPSTHHQKDPFVQGMLVPQRFYGLPRQIARV